MRSTIISLQSEAGFEALYKHAPIGILAVGEKGLIEFANPCAEKIFGYEQGELIGKNHGILLSSGLREKHRGHVTNYFENPSDRTMAAGVKLNGHKKNGRSFPVEIGLASYQYNGRKIALAFVNDITEHERAKDELRASEQNLHFLIEHTPAAIAMFDRQMRYIAVSRRFLKDYQLTGRNIIGMSHYDVFPELPERWRELHQRCLAGEGSRCSDDPFPRADGSTDWVQWELCPWYAANATVGGVVLFSEVITAQKLLEERLRNYATDLERTVKMRTKSLQQVVTQLQTAKRSLTESLEKEKELSQLKSTFVSMASHEFRTPLTTILLSANLIDKYSNVGNNPNITQHIGKIKKATFNLTGILDDFLSLEKLERGRVKASMADFDIVKLADEIAEEMQLAAKKDQRIIYSHVGSRKIVRLDRNLLKNCIVNLISNAIKYSGERTMIEFETEITDSECKIIVRDNGIGIPDNEQQHLFEAFFRAHNTGTIPGTGLGLNIVARYVKLMNGNIEFKSKLNAGTRFVLTFPQAA
ncbi:MAG: PAS domain S-box protein [Bacteroidetes bacterium]|nr:PAS domain S-box protein [Bacteroidota bacterium]